MGTWGVGIWESADAVAVLGELGARPSKHAVLGLLGAARDAEHAVAVAGDGVGVLCAADLLARSAGKLGPAPTKVTKLTFAWAATDAELAQAAAAVENIAIYSELATLWEQVNDYAEWVAALDDLRARLGAAPLPRQRPVFRSTISRAPTRADLERAVDAMRAGVLQAAVLRHKLGTTDEDLALFALATSPLGDGVHEADEPVTAHDIEVYGYEPLYITRERSVLDDPMRLAGEYYVDDLAPPLWRMLRCALLAGRTVRVGDRKRIALDPLRFARQLLELLLVLGGDAEVGLLSLISGREVDDDGSFGRALALAHAFGVWAVATVEGAATTAAARSLAEAAPLLVLARVRLRMRANWDSRLDFNEAARRMPAWSGKSAAVLAAVNQRADALADLLAVVEAPDAHPPAGGGRLEPGALALLKKCGVTVVLATAGANVIVGGFGRPSKPFVRVAPSFVTALAIPAVVGRVLLRAPDLP